jgi:saccharopine dehydrogenase (NAD+, L-lysine-forming)
MGRDVLLLGGYGHAGRELAPLLVAHTTRPIVIAGRDPRRAQALADSLNHHMGTERCRGVAVDIAEGAALRRVLDNHVDLVINAAPARDVTALAQVISECGSDWIDLAISLDVMRSLRALEPAIRDAGRCFVTQAGSHPGLPAALVRWAASRVDTLTSAWVSAVLRDRDGLPLTGAAGEFLNWLRELEAHVTEGGVRRRASFWSTTDMPVIDFGEPFGRRRTYVLDWPELDELHAQAPGLPRLGFSMAGLGPVADYLAMPIVFAGVKLPTRRLDRPLARLLTGSTRRFVRAPFGTLMQVDATGLRANQRVRVQLSVGHPSAYGVTAVAVAALVLQLLDGTCRAPGVHLMGMLVEPRQLMQDMTRLGARVEAGEHVPVPIDA